jgi:ATP-dependent helicase HrpB
LETVAAGRIETRAEVSFDAAAMAVRARRSRRLDAIVLESTTQPVPPTLETAGILAAGLAQAGIDRLPWSKEQLQLRDRVAFIRARKPEDDSFPDLSDTALAGSVGQWLAPSIVGALSATAVTPDMLNEALRGLLPYALRRRLDEMVPTHFEAPTGNRHAIDYESDGAPVLAIRVQELFGLKQHPAIGGGRVPLTLHLLSPAHRPIQITRDLPGFWRGSWREVRSEMKGRYPRHVWPEDPETAVPTTRAKPRK